MVQYGQTKVTVLSAEGKVERVVYTPEGGSGGTTTIREPTSKGGTKETVITDTGRGATAPVVTESSQPIESQPVPVQPRQQLPSANPAAISPEIVNTYLSEQAGTYGKVSVPSSVLVSALNKSQNERRYYDETGRIVNLTQEQKTAIQLESYFEEGKGNYGTARQPEEYYSSLGLASPEIETVSSRSQAQQIEQGVFYTPEPIKQKESQQLFTNGDVKTNNFNFSNVNQEDINTTAMGGRKFGVPTFDSFSFAPDTNLPDFKNLPGFFLPSTSLKGKVSQTPQENLMSFSPGSFGGRVLTEYKPEGFFAKGKYKIDKFTYGNPLEGSTQLKALAAVPAYAVLELGNIVANPIETAEGTVKIGYNLVTNPYETGGQLLTELSVNPSRFVGQNIAGFALGKGISKGFEFISPKIEPKVSDIRAGEGVQFVSQEGKSISFQEQDVTYNVNRLFGSKEYNVDVKGLSVSKPLNLDMTFADVSAMKYSIDSGVPKEAAYAGITKTMWDEFLSYGQTYMARGKKVEVFPTATRGIKMTSNEGLNTFSTVTAIEGVGGEPFYLSAGRLKETSLVSEDGGFFKTFETAGAGASRNVDLGIELKPFDITRGLGEISQTQKEVPSFPSGNMMVTASPSKTMLQTLSPEIMKDIVGLEKESRARRSGTMEDFGRIFGGVPRSNGEVMTRGGFDFGFNPFERLNNRPESIPVFEDNVVSSPIKDFMKVSSFSGVKISKGLKESTGQASATLPGFDIGTLQGQQVGQLPGFKTAQTTFQIPGLTPGGPPNINIIPGLGFPGPDNMGGSGKLPMSLQFNVPNMKRDYVPNIGGLFSGVKLKKKPTGFFSGFEVRPPVSPKRGKKK